MVLKPLCVLLYVCVHLPTEPSSQPRVHLFNSCALWAFGCTNCCHVSDCLMASTAECGGSLGDRGQFPLLWRWVILQGNTNQMGLVSVCHRTESWCLSLSLSPRQFEKHILNCCFSLLAHLEPSELQNPVIVSRAICTMVCGEARRYIQAPRSLQSKCCCGLSTPAQPS